MGFWDNIKNWFINIFNRLSEFAEPFRNFIAENSRNPFIWIMFIVIGLIIFELVYRALHKN